MSQQQNRPDHHEVLRQARDRVRAELDLADGLMLGIAKAAPGQLSDRMGRIMSRKGKRVRSTLLFLLSETGVAKPTAERKARAAASVEMLHLASLVHDDVIDESSMRRGQVTAHEEWGNKMAVLVGDYFLSKSMELVVADEDRRMPVIISEAASRLVAGEVLELDLAGKLDVSLESYTEVIEGKTGALIDACARCGAILAGHSPELVDDCGRMGMHFGIAFQIIDDLLDYGVGAGDLGKATFSDIQNGLVTLPMLLYLRSSSQRERDEMAALLKTAAEPGVPGEISRRLAERNSFHVAQDIAMEHVGAALEVLSKLPATESRDVLLEVCGTMAFRHC